MHMKLVFLLAVQFVCSTVLASPSLVLARAPQLSPSIISQQWGPFIKHLSVTTGIDITLKVYTDRASFEHDILAGKVDLYFGNPGYGIIGHLLHGYTPIIRSNRKLLEGILVVKKDSGIKNIEQLNNKIIAFPDENAFAASLYIRARMNSDLKIDFQPLYTGSHNNSYRAVLIGKAAAGGGVQRTLENEDSALREQLLTIYTTPGMKSHPLMIHPKVSENIRNSIQQAILDMDTDSAGKKLLKTIKLQQPVIADYLRDYKSVESFAIEAYQNMMP